jgi:hypothetical protein
VQCGRLRGLGRVRRRVQLPLLELPSGDRVGILALGRDWAREAEGDEGRRLGDGDRRCRRRPCDPLRSVRVVLYWTVRDRTYVRVPYGSLVDEPALKPTAHMFVGSKAPWHEILDDLPQHDEYPWS